MKKFFRILILVLLGFGFIYTIYYLYSKDQEAPVVYKTEEPTTRNIYRKTVATGSIVPREEVEIKPRVSGVLTEIFVEPGQLVKKNQKMAKITIIPDVVTLNNAENRLKTARISLKNLEKELKRNKDLLEADVISEQDFQRMELNFDLAKEEVKAAENNVVLVREGALKGASNKSNNLVLSTVDGMVLDVPVKQGTSVIESNSFNPGTTVITVADMDDLIFEGTVDESEVGKIKEGMPLKLKIGAIEGQEFEGLLEFIAPKGELNEGTIQFDIKASLTRQENIFVRAGYSANAEIILEARENVLAINEGLVVFKDDKSYVEIERGEQDFEQTEVELGLSDGIYVEVKSGVQKADKVKIQETYGRP